MMLRPGFRLVTSITALTVAGWLAGCATPQAIPSGLEAQVPHPWSDAGQLMEASAAVVDGRADDGQRIDRVYLQCAVVQGNGYNWASTLGWLASQADLVAQQAMRYEAAHPGRHARVNLSCVTGSSSGGAVTSLMDHLLANPRVVHGAGGESAQLLTPAQAREVSKALFLLALSADFSGETVGLAFTGIGAYLGWLDRRSQGVPVSLWRAKSTPARNRAIFGKWIRAASAYDPTWFDEVVGEDPWSIPTFSRRPAELGHDRDHVADARMKELAGTARRIVEKRSRIRHFEFKPVGDGFCVTSLAVPLDGDAPPFDIDDLILTTLCNDATADRLVAGPALARLLAQRPSTSRRLHLAGSDDWTTLLNTTVREPDLVTPLSGKPLEPPIGFDQFAAFDGEAFQQLQSTEDHLMLGGFAGPRQQAWAATALLLQRMQEWRSRGVEVEGRLALFGRTEDRSDPTATFAQQTVVKYFAGEDGQSEEDGANPRVLQAYYDWQDEFCGASSSVRDQVAVDFFRMDWNLTSSPAAMTKRSRELAALGYNLGKVQAERSDYPEVPATWFDAFVFAPEDTVVFLPPRPEAGMSCETQG